MDTNDKSRFAEPESREALGIRWKQAEPFSRSAHSDANLARAIAEAKRAWRQGEHR